MQRLETAATVEEGSGKIVEQFGMTGRAAVDAEIIRRRHDALTKVVLPDTIDEDARGEPFVDRAGQLLTDIIERVMGLRRADVYICNVIKCRPPENRNPEPDEVAACEPFLLRQLELIGPEVVVALGKFAAQTLLRTKTPITQIRGRWFDYHGIRVTPTVGIKGRTRRIVCVGGIVRTTP